MQGGRNTTGARPRGGPSELVPREQPGPSYQDGRPASSKAVSRNGRQPRFRTGRCRGGEMTRASRSVEVCRPEPTPVEWTRGLGVAAGQFSPPVPGATKETPSWMLFWPPGEDHELVPRTGSTQVRTGQCTYTYVGGHLLCSRHGLEAVPASPGSAQAFHAAPCGSTGCKLAGQDTSQDPRAPFFPRVKPLPGPRPRMSDSQRRARQRRRGPGILVMQSRWAGYCSRATRHLPEGSSRGQRLMHREARIACSARGRLRARRMMASGAMPQPVLGWT